MFLLILAISILTITFVGIVAFALDGLDFTHPIILSILISSIIIKYFLVNCLYFIIIRGRHHSGVRYEVIFDKENCVSTIWECGLIKESLI